MKIFNCFFLILICLLNGCVNSQKTTSLVLSYEDFGPQAMAWELIGMQWWQWNSHGDSQPEKYDIRIVVYKDITINEVEKKYPVIPEKPQDYRYLAYPAALKYLENKIEENAIPSLTERLNNTKKKLTETFREK